MEAHRNPKWRGWRWVGVQTVITVTVKQAWKAWMSRTTTSLSNTHKSPYKYSNMLGLGQEKGCPIITSTQFPIIDTDGYICIHLWVCEPSRDKARDAFSASLVTLSNVSLMQTSVLDNHFQTLRYFLYSWGLNRGENGLWVQSWDSGGVRPGTDVALTFETSHWRLLGCSWVNQLRQRLLEASRIPFSLKNHYILRSSIV